MINMASEKGHFSFINMLCFVFMAALIFLLSPSRVQADEEEEWPDNSIPVVYIEIDETQVPIADMNSSPDHSVYCYGTVRIEVPKGFHYADFPDLACESTGSLSMSIRGRGNSSWRQPDKKPYKIKLEKKADLFGLGKNKHWALLANAFDPSLLRNRVSGWLGDQMDFEFTPRGVPVDVVMIGQEFGTHYLGSYYLAENVRIDTNRLEIDELEESDVEERAITGGYLLQNALQVREGSPDRFYTSRGVDWATDTPSFDTEAGLTLSGEDADLGTLGENAMEEPDELGDAYDNPTQQQYIQRHIQIVEDALCAEGTEYLDLMDIESAAKYWLIDQFTKNNDGYATGSTYIYKKRDVNGVTGKIYWGPLWDYDFAYDRNFTVEGFSAGHLWVEAMFCHREDNGLAAEILKQWPVMKAAAEELVKDGGLIDQYYAEALSSAEKDLAMNHPGDDTSYQEYVQNLKEWIKGRVAWMDAHMGEIHELVHKVTYMVDDTIWDVELVEQNKPVTVLDRRPEKEGYVFLGWADENGQLIGPELIPDNDTTIHALYLSDEEAIHAEDIVFHKVSDIIRPGYIRVYTIDYRILPTNAQDQMIKWTSSDESIATIDEFGMVHYEPLDDETDTVTVTLTGTLRNGLSRSFTLTILRDELPSAESIRPVEPEIRLEAGQQHGYTIITDPDPAVIYSYEFESEDPSVVTVDDFGILTAVAPGETLVRLTAETGDGIMLETEMQVTVSNGDEPDEESESSEGPESEEESEPAEEQSLLGGASTQSSESSETRSPDPLWFILGGAAVLIALVIIVWRIRKACKKT